MAETNLLWRATTETGTTYEYNGHHVLITPERSLPYSIRPHFFMSAPNIPTLMVPWNYADYHRDYYDDNIPEWISSSPKYSFEPTPWYNVERPVLGERFLVFGKDEWRISTLIECLEEFSQ